LTIEERLKEIEQRYIHLIEDILVLTLSDEIFKIILKLRGQTTLRVMERWKNNELVRYSYYWLDSDDNIKIGWDNAPHHKKMNNYPHHKHIGGKIEPSYEYTLDQVLNTISNKLK